MKEERIVSYVSSELKEWLKEQCKRYALNESSMIRYLLTRIMSNDKK